MLETNYFDLLECIFTLGVAVSQIYSKIGVHFFVPQTLAAAHTETKIRRYNIEQELFILHKNGKLVSRSIYHVFQSYSKELHYNEAVAVDSLTFVLTS